MVTFFKKIPEMDMAKNTTISRRITDMSTFFHVFPEIGVTNLMTIYFPPVDSQTYSENGGST